MFRAWHWRIDLHLKYHMHTHTILVRVKATVREGHGKLQPNISVPSTTVQKLFHENPMSHYWPSETMMRGKFPFDHPSVVLGDQFVYEVLHNHESWNFPAGVSFALKQNMYWGGFCAFLPDISGLGGGRGPNPCKNQQI